MRRVLALATLGTFLSHASPMAVHAGGPEVSRVTLENGLRLVLSQQTSVPIVAIDCLVDGGARVDPVDRPGLAALTASLLEEGTEGRTSQDIALLIDSLGGSFETGGSSDWIYASSAVLSRDFETGVDLVSKSLRVPTFAPDAVERIRADTLGDIQSAEENPGYVSMRGFRKALFGDAPYGHPVEGTSESLRAITRDEIVRFHGTWIRPERTICAIVGDVEPAKMESVAREKLSAWARGGPAPEPSPATAKPATAVLIDMATTQANVVVGQIGVARENPDFFAIRLMNHILGGGGFTSRLVNRVRDAHGLAYSVGSSFDSSRFAGPFQVVLQTKVESAGEAIRLVREEIEKLHDQGATEEELHAAQDYLTGNFPQNLDSTAKLAGLLAQIEYFGLGDDYIEKYGERVRAVTLEEVRDAAREYLHPDALVRVVVGPEELLASQGLAEDR